MVIPDRGQPNPLPKNATGFEVSMVEYVTQYLRFWGQPLEWIEKIVAAYKSEDAKLPPPQLSVASWIVAGLATNVLFNLATHKPVKIFPKFYLSSVLNDDN